MKVFPGKKLGNHIKKFIPFMLLIMVSFPINVSGESPPVLEADRLDLFQGHGTSVNLTISNVTNLNSATFNLSFNSSVISITSIQLGDLFIGGELIYNIQNQRGWSGVFINFSNMEVTGSGTLASVHITSRGVAGSKTYLNLTPLGGVLLTDAIGNEIIPDIINGTVAIILDNIPPKIVVYSPENKTYYSSAIPITFSVDEALTEAYFSLNGHYIEIINHSCYQMGICNLSISLPLGSHYIIISANDTAGNMDFEKVFFEIVNPPISIPVSGRGGGGGGGGGGGSNEATAFVSRIGAGEEEVFEFSPSKSPFVREILITANKDTYSLGLSVKYPSKKPYGTPEISREVYKYIEIKKSNAIGDNDIQKALINFKVDKDWLSMNNINEEKVFLVRYNDSQWSVLETIKTIENEFYVFYSASSPGLSYFAIIGDKGSGFKENDMNPPRSLEDIDWENFSRIMEREDFTRENRINDNAKEGIFHENPVSEIIIETKDNALALRVRIVILMESMAETAMNLLIRPD